MDKNFFENAKLKSYIGHKNSGDLIVDERVFDWLISTIKEQQKEIERLKKGWREQESNHNQDKDYGLKVISRNLKYREALEEIFELSKHDGESRYLDKCYVVARQALEGESS